MDTAVQSDWTLERFGAPAGYRVEHHYDSYEEMVASAEFWDFQCTYQMLTGGYTGCHFVLQLPTMQYSYAERDGGFMYRGRSRLDGMNVAVITRCEGPAVFDDGKLEEGDIVFFDNSRAYNFMSSGPLSFIIAGIHRDSLGSFSEHLDALLHRKLKDTDGEFAALLASVRRRCDRGNDPLCGRAHEVVLEYLRQMLKSQTPFVRRLSRSEKIALEIRDRLYSHMDAVVEIRALAKEYGISEKSLQNGFRSLFGFTPKQFIRLLKLNLVHHDLRRAQYGEEKVIRIANRWGFFHMGNFTRYYKELFGQTPVETLRQPPPELAAISNLCVERREEID